MTQIELTNKQIVDIFSQQAVINKLFNRDFKPKTSYWLTKIFKHLEQEIKHYETARKKLLEKYAEKYESDGEEKNKKNEVIKKWNVGDIKTDEFGQAVFNGTREQFDAEIKELFEISVPIGIDLIEFDCEKQPDLTIKEMMILEPLIQIK